MFHAEPANRMFPEETYILSAASPDGPSRGFAALFAEKLCFSGMSLRTQAAVPPLQRRHTLCLWSALLDLVALEDREVE